MGKSGVIKIPKKELNINNLITPKNNKDIDLILKFKGLDISVNLNRLMILALIRTGFNYNDSYILNYNKTPSNEELDCYKQLIHRRFGGIERLKKNCGFVG